MQKALADTVLNNFRYSALNKWLTFKNQPRKNIPQNIIYSFKRGATFH